MRKKKLLSIFCLAIIISIIACSETTLKSHLKPEINGWERAASPEVYTPDNLWEYINGGAEKYIDFGFEKVVTAEYKKENKSAIVDIYRFKTAAGALGIYGESSSPDYEYIETGDEGYLTSSALRVRKGVHLLKISAFSDIDTHLKSYKKLLREIVKNLPESGKLPDLTDRFPEKYRIPHTLGYSPKVDSFPGFKDVFYNRYKKDGTEFKVLITRWEKNKPLPEEIEKRFKKIDIPRHPGTGFYINSGPPTGLIFRDNGRVTAVEGKSPEAVKEFTVEMLKNF